MTALLDPRRHAARLAPPPATPALPAKPRQFSSGARIEANAGGSVLLLPGATPAHIAELHALLDALARTGGHA